MNDDKPQPRHWLLVFASGGCVVDVLGDLGLSDWAPAVLIPLIVVGLLLMFRAWHQRTWVRRAKEISR